MKNLGKIGSSILLALLFIIGFYQQNLPKKSSLDVVNNALHDIGVATKTSDCHVNGALPDSACSPGAIFPDATKEIICVSGYTKKVRNVTTTTKKNIYTAYGIVYPQPTGSYEADHIIPLELGGSNEVANLFPEAGSPTPGFHEKDIVENYLHQEVCAGRIELVTAQKQIASDWLSVYNALTPQQITELRGQFTSWTDKN
jgi:hypothetical protein